MNTHKLQESVDEYIKVEDIMKKNAISVRGHINNKKQKGDQEYNSNDKYLRISKDSDYTSKKNSQGQKFADYTRLNILRSRILMSIEKDKVLRWLKPLRTGPEKRNKNLFFRF